jgi:FeS assembly protein IscX
VNSTQFTIYHSAFTDVEAIMKLTWNDAEDIALELLERYPATDPLTVRFTDLHAWVITLHDFSDDPKKSNEGILEAIQMAWHEEVLSSG